MNVPPSYSVPDDNLMIIKLFPGIFVVSLSLFNATWRLDSTSVHAWRVGFIFCWHPPVENHMMLLCCFVMFYIWFQGEGPNSELNGVFVQHGSSPKRASMHTAASNKAVKMCGEAPRQHTPPGSCCLPGAHLQIIYCGRRCQSVLQGYTVFI